MNKNLKHFLCDFFSLWRWWAMAYEYLYNFPPSWPPFLHNPHRPLSVGGTEVLLISGGNPSSLCDFSSFLSDFCTCGMKIYFSLLDSLDLVPHLFRWMIMNFSVIINYSSSHFVPSSSSLLLTIHLAISAVGNFKTWAQIFDTSLTERWHLCPFFSHLAMHMPALRTEYIGSAATWLLRLCHKKL